MKTIHFAAAGLMLAGFAGSVKGQVITGTTYEYTQNVSFGDPGSTDAARYNSFGSGQLNDGVFGSNTWLQTTGGAPSAAFNHEGVGQPGGVYFSPGDTIIFNLGAVYNLASVTLGLVDDAPVGVTAPGTVTVSDGVNPTVTSNTYLGDSTGAIPGWTYYNGGFGSAYNEAYNTETIPLTGLSGQNITLTFANNLYGSGGWIGLNEVQFNQASVPEPASVALVGLGSLSLLVRRRARKA